MDGWPQRLRPVLDVLVRQCQSDERVRAAWLGGSLGRGVADEWSDINLHVLVSDDFDALAWAGQQLDLVLADRLHFDGGYILVTSDWVHVDLIVHTDPNAVDALPGAVLVDRVGSIPERVEEPEDAGGPYLPERSPELFIYFMGNLVTVAHRGEWIVLAAGTAVMRDQHLVPLMLAENGVRKQDGAKRLNRYLTAEQRDALAALPAIGMDAEGLLAAQRAIAEEYLRRGHRLYAALAAEWPDDLEAAALDLWRRELDLEVDLP